MALSSSLSFLLPNTIRNFDSHFIKVIVLVTGRVMEWGQKRNEYCKKFSSLNYKIWDIQYFNRIYSISVTVPHYTEFDRIKKNTIVTLFVTFYPVTWTVTRWHGSLQYFLSVTDIVTKMWRITLNVTFNVTLNVIFTVTLTVTLKSNGKINGISNGKINGISNGKNHVQSDGKRNASYFCKVASNAYNIL